MLLLLFLTALILFASYFYMRRGKSVNQINYEKDVVYLFTFKPTKITPNFSPFCMKVLLYLELRQINYVTRYDVFPGPRGLLPFIEINGQTISDSSCIVTFLDEYFQDPEYPAAMKAGHRAESNAIQRVIENSMYWCLLRGRWMDDNGWKATAELISFNLIPAIVRPVVKMFVRSQTIGKLSKVGYAAYSDDEIVQIFRNDLESLAYFLGKKDFFHGDYVSMTDLIVFSTLANILYFSFKDKLFGELMKHQNLVDHCARMKENFKTLFIN